MKQDGGTKWWRFLLVAAVCLALLAAAPFLGPEGLVLSEVFDFTGEPPLSHVIFFQFRLPRVIFAFLVGASLAMAGSIFQSIMRNDLATPYTLGLSGGISLGALITLLIIGPGSLTALGGLVGGTVTILLILALAKRLRGGEGTVSLLLAGITLNLLFGSAILIVQYLSDPYQTFSIIRWLMGGVDVLVSYTWLGIFAVILAVPALFLWARGRAMNVLELGDQTARSLGVRPEGLRWQAISAAAFLTILVVSFAGPIGFVGLIVPHAVRRLVGWDNRVLLPGCLLVGGVFLVLADSIGRVVGRGLEIPVGIVTALIGGPVFLWILLRKGGRV